MVSLVNFRQFSEPSELDGLPRQNCGTLNEDVELTPAYLSKPTQEPQNGHKSHKYAFAQNQVPIVQLGGEKLPAYQFNNSSTLTKEHFEIRWSNLNYQVEPKWYQRNWRESFSLTATKTSTNTGTDAVATNTPTSTKRTATSILNNLNGSVKSGEVTAVLGPSGAGKTSLLGCLTGKNKSGVSGSVQVISTNGGPGRLEPLSICTIPQKDYLLNQLTVRENLWFASRLKHPIKRFNHEANIERVIELLKLESCLDTKISKISGGQYKRVSIAQELLSNPDILILDEPTSGLDSLTCYKTVMVLRDLARLSPNPMAIIVTIHQPQREVFDLFNHVYILAVGGRCIYDGHPSESIKTINDCSGGLHFDADQYNPASYLVEIASVEFGEKPIEALVEHQRNQFKCMTEAQDQRNYAITLATGGDLTPASKKLRPIQSPMINRFKTTLSSLTGSASSPQLSTKSASPRVVMRRPRAVYANEAYESTNELNLSHTAVQQTEQHLNNNIIYDNTNTKNHPNNVDDSASSSSSTPTTLPPDGDYNDGEFYLDTRLQTHKHNHKGHFLRHCQLLTKRSWLCLCKDPMLTTLRFSAHILVPLLITIVYGSKVGKPNACPLYESEMDLIDYARHGAKRLLGLQDELRCTFENVGLYFLSVYAFTFSTMCLTSLSFPLNMHVLLKEVRNGWYSIPTYFIGKTLADFPLEFILPTLTLMITYPLTGQPSSYLEWRFLLATSIFVVTSLIAQTQGLIFGALFMNAMQAAVFVAPVSTTPLILLSGFLIRISQMPVYLQKLSTLSYFRYAIESLTIIRYGFGQCECDPQVVNGKPVSASGVPDQLRTMTNYWLSTFDVANSDANTLEASDYSTINDTISDLVTTTASSLIANASTTPNATAVVTPQVDFFQDLTVLLARANSFGTEIKTCDDLKPYPMIDFSLQDEQLYTWVVALLATLVFSKVANYYVVKYSVKWRL